MNRQRLVGITVMPEYLQSEGIGPVLDNVVDRAGANAVATSPYVMAEADEATGGREPPIDAGAGSVRLLDRPLWGKRELWVRTAPSFRPDVALYENLRYQPAPPNDLTEQHGAVIDQFIAAAHGRGLKVYFQVMAASPPGYRVQFGGPMEDDAPRLPDGRIPPRRVDNNGSLASPHIVAYQHALIRDLCRKYPEIDGFRFDWPEYPPYLLDSAFLDFSEHARAAGERLGFDFSTMRQAAASLYELLHGGLTDDMLRAVLEKVATPGSWSELLEAGLPAIAESLKFKAALSDELLAGFRQVMNDEKGPELELAPSAFPPPWSLVSGAHFERIARHCDAVSVKLYGMHWAMMLWFYGDELRAANQQVSESLLVRALVRILGIADDDGLPSLDDYSYPAPDQPHPSGRQAQLDKIATAQAAAGATPIHVLAHGYGPLADFRDRIRIAHQASPHGFWINRYGYLSDEKLDAVGSVVGK